MKKTWVLSIKTTLPDVCYRISDCATKIYTFDNFKEARDATRNILKRYAFSKNSMFDGNGRLIYLLNYIETCMDPSDKGEEWMDGVITPERLTKVHETLQSMFSGKDVKENLEEGDFTDWFIAYCYKNGEIRFCGDDDGPCNGYDPILRTNMFSMIEERNYYLYIDDLLGQDNASSELYIDLIQAEKFAE